MSKNLAPFGVYLQDFIAKTKQFTLSSIDIDEKQKKFGIAHTPEVTRETIREHEGVSADIRKEGQLLSVLDNYCAVLPIIIKEITTH